MSISGHQAHSLAEGNRVLVILEWAWYYVTRQRGARLITGAETPLLLAATLAALSPLAAAPARPPNVVLIFADDLGWKDVGFNGCTDIKTPNIDALAQGGAKFTQFYVQPMCTPTRAALMTGFYPNRVGMSGALNHTSTTGLSPKERTLAERLKEPYKRWKLAEKPAVEPLWPMCFQPL